MTPPSPHRSTPLIMLAGIGLLIGGWAMLPAYSGPVLNTADRVEFVDHVVPGIAVLVVTLAGLVVGRRRETGAVAFLAGLGIVLAGVWMTATHAPLVLQATRQEAPWGATIYHSLPPLAVLGLGIVWAYTFRDAMADEDDGDRVPRSEPTGGAG